MTDESSPPVTQTNSRVEQIISRGRQHQPGARGTAVLVGTTACLMWAAFTPLDWGPLGWICLMPMLLLARLPQRTRWMYRLTFLGGVLYWLATLQWMRFGHSTMYFALIAQAVYLACYWPLFLGMLRLAVSRFGVPLYLSAPILWTGLEYLRAYMATGFSWYYLGHTQHHWTEIIQISDLTGAYGVTFLVVLCNAALAEVIPVSWLDKLGLFRHDREMPVAFDSPLRKFAPVSLSLLAVIVSFAYGTWRRTAAEFQAGPKVALIQGNFPATVESDREQWGEIFRTHHYLTGKTVPLQPDVVVWPEAMFRYPMLEFDESLTDEELDSLHDYLRATDWKNRATQDKLADIAEMSNAALIIGIPAFAATPAGYFVYNSAAFVRPGDGVVDRYDKIHRVPFGEYIPFEDQLAFLQSMTPYRGDFGIDAGTSVKVFESQGWRMVPLICFEDTVPHLVRNMVAVATENAQQPVDVLVNMTNDGWFHGSSELDQHLITSSFRAIETRTPLVRAVNTGISAIIDGDGVVREPEHLIDLDAELHGGEPRTSMRDPKTGRFHRQFNAAIVDHVPLDRRTSLYVRYGDWFAGLCLAGCIATVLSGILFRRSTSVSVSGSPDPNEATSTTSPSS